MYRVKASEEYKQDIQKLRNKGYTYQEIADLYKCTRQNIHALCKRYKIIRQIIES